MVCRFILGRAGSGKTHYCLSEMARRLRQPRQTTEPLLFLLPEQATFIHERMLADQYLPHGYSGGEVTSFSRLVGQAGQQQAGAALPQLSEAGRSLLMGKLLSERRSQLQVFGAASAGSGLAQQLVSVAEELMIYGVEPEQLRAVAAQRTAGAPRDPFTRKLGDIALLYTEYRAAITGQYDNFADGMLFLRRQILEHGFLAGATVFVDGYSQFTPREQGVLEALMQRVARLEIAFALDPTQLQRSLQPDDLFYPSWRAYGALVEAARRLRVPVEPPLCLDQAQGRFCDNPELAFLESNCYPLHKPAAWPQQPHSLHLTAALDRHDELEAVGRQILRLVREQGVHFHQISVIARESQPYAELLPVVFGELGIPYFVDAKKPLIYHPLLELVRSALEIWAGEPHYRAVFRYLKTGFTPLTMSEVDKLENYCLAHGIRHWQWKQAEDWQWWRAGGDAQEAETRLAEINALRRRGMAALQRFLAAAPPAAGQVPLAPLLRQLALFLEDLDVAATLRAWQEQALVAQDGEQAALHRQAYDKLSAFLSEALLLLGESSLAAPQVIGMMDAGCAALTVSTIPPGLDQVVVASLERSRNPELAAAFVIGLNADQLPQKIPADALLSDYERGELGKAGLSLAPDTLTRQMAEHYLAYIALTRSGQRLYLSYTLAGEDGKGMQPSPLVRRIRALFPQLPLQRYAEEDDPQFLAGGSSSLVTLARKLSEARAGAEPPHFWRDVYHWYAAQSEWSEPLARLSQGLDFQSHTGQLEAATLQRLYGAHLPSSVSRLEKFRSCPFAYFAAYGLRLRERPHYDVTPLERGDIFHQALAEIGRRMEDGEQRWQDIDEESAAALVEQVLAKLLPQFLAGILSSTARYRYLAERIKNTLTDTVLLMAEHMRRGAFVPVAWELPFGSRPDDLLPPLRIALEDGRYLELNGQIDRVDLARGQQQSYLRVIDYKTGDMNLRVEDIFAGLRLQLLVYLQVVLDNRLYFQADDAAAAGLYYMPVRDQYQNVEMPPEQQAAGDLAGLKLAGLTVLDEEAVRLADPQVKGHSKLIPVALSENGFYANTPGISPAHLELLRKHLLELLRETANQLVSGLVAVSPRRDKNFDACAYCDYQAFCGFDGNLAQPYQTAQLNAEQIWQILAEEADKHGT